MKLKNFVFILYCIFFGPSVFAQNIILDGNYEGKNLYILNPGHGNGYCVSEVRVNGKKTRDEINSNSFEIDFSQMNIEKGKKVHVEILHPTDCNPVIINPEILQGKPYLRFVNVKVNRNGFLCWDVAGNLGEGVLTVEQYRWGKWVKAGEISTKDTVIANNFTMEVSPNTAQNLFRIKFTDAQNYQTVSKEIKYTLPGKEIMITGEKIKDRIVFTSVTMYEIVDEVGNIVVQGNDKYIDTSTLRKGKYFINYDNKTEAYYKK